MQNIRLLLSLILLSTLLACNTDKDEEPKPNDNYTGIRFTEKGTLTLPIQHVFNTTPFEMNKYYITPLNDSIKCSELSYYFTNVSLLNANNEWINLGNYDLIENNNPESKTIVLPNVPAGDYSSIRFMIGVDSIANSTGSHEGELSPAYGMYWSWATGYVFFRFKGRTSGNRSVSFDIGGNQNLPIAEIPLNSLKNSGKSITMNIAFNLAEIFVNPHNYSLDSNSIDIHTAIDPDVYKLRDNIAKGAFTITTVL
ncbi:MAG: hypothetical protein IT246_03125 [Bacteroidia bacterium]|nr:hypothetical protein [Bacteroidia bacterium]